MQQMPPIITMIMAIVIPELRPSSDSSFKFTFVFEVMRWTFTSCFKRYFKETLLKYNSNTI